MEGMCELYRSGAKMRKAFRGGIGLAGRMTKRWLEGRRVG